MAQEFNTRLIPVAVNFLKTLNVPFTKRALKQRLESNPYYPSLYSLSEVFNRYNIENKGLQIEKEQLDELPIPFLADIRIKETGGNDFVNVTHVNNDSVTYYYGKEITTTKEEFINNWQSNIVLLAEATEGSREMDFKKNSKVVTEHRNRTYLLLFGFSLILVYGISKYLISSGDIPASFSFLLFTLAGLAISTLLLMYEVDKSNTFVKNICTGGARTNCDAVLGSKAAKLFGISWGEIGFFYFCSMLLFLLVPGISFIEKTTFISCVSVLSSMYIPFSLFYQYKVIKQWCRLCLFIQAVLFFNVCWALRFGDFAVNFSGNNIIFLTGCAVSPILFWYALKPVLIKAKDSDKFLAAYKRLYSRQDVFDLTLADQPEAPDGWKDLGIQKGNPHAENIILKVCNPICPHCNTAQEIFNDLLSNNNNVKMVILYNVNNDEEGGLRKLVVRHFLAMAEQEPGNTLNSKLFEAINYWYLTKNSNYDTLKKNFPVSEELLEKQNKKIEVMSDWCTAAEIEYTPTVYINGRKLPSTFNLSDLKDIF